MQVREALRFGAYKLSKFSTRHLDTRLLLSFAMDLTYEQLLLNYDKELSQEIENKFLQLICRRQSMEPIAYILGAQEFYGLEFFVNKNVLIPRPETELLIDVVLNDYKKNCKNEAISILDLGTGSGAIAVILANKIIKSKITALDISNSALNVARKNAKKHNLLGQIEFIQSNWYKNLEAKKYDYIVSNPPYIARKEKVQMACETHMFEPETALYAEDDGLADYKKILVSANQYLKPNGKLLLEIGYLQKSILSELIQKYGFTILSIHSDLAGHDRIIIAINNRV